MAFNILELVPFVKLDEFQSKCKLYGYYNKFYNNINNGRMWIVYYLVLLLSLRNRLLFIFFAVIRSRASTLMGEAIATPSAKAKWYCFLPVMAHSD